MKNFRTFSNAIRGLGLGLISLGLLLPLIQHQDTSSLEPVNLPIHFSADASPLALAPIPAPLKSEVSPEQREEVEQQLLVEYLSDHYRQPQEMVERIIASAYKESAQHDLPPLLIVAIIMKESSLRASVQNGYGAMGLMQVVPRFHMDKIPAGKSPKEVLLKPESNIQVGTQILAEYLRLKDGSLSAALKKYSGNARNYEVVVNRFQRELEEIIDPDVVQARVLS